jgi:hypothetical protein
MASRNVFCRSRGKGRLGLCAGRDVGFMDERILVTRARFTRVGGRALSSNWQSFATRIRRQRTSRNFFSTNQCFFSTKSAKKTTLLPLARPQM